MNVPPLTFYRPKQRAIDFLIRFARAIGGSTIVDIGAGTGYLSRRLIDTAGERVSVLSFDKFPNEDALVSVLPIDVNAFPFISGFLPVIARPCHGDFPSEAINRAVSRSGLCLYIGFARNTEDDFATVRDYPPRLLEPFESRAGLEFESIYFFGNEELYKMAHEIASSLPERPNPGDAFEPGDETAPAPAVPVETPAIIEPVKAFPEPNGAKLTGPLHTPASPFGSYFDRVLIVRDKSFVPPPGDTRTNLGLTLIGIRDDTQYWNLSRSHCEYQKDKWEIYHEFARADFPAEWTDREVNEKVSDAFDWYCFPVPCPISARLGFIAPNGDFYPCGYLCHNGLAILLEQRFRGQLSGFMGGGKERLKDNGWLEVAGEGYIHGSGLDYAATTAQKTALASLLRAFEDEEEKIGASRLREALNENPEGYADQYGWSPSWTEESIGKMRQIIAAYNGEEEPLEDADVPLESPLDDLTAAALRTRNTLSVPRRRRSGD